MAGLEFKNGTLMKHASQAELVKKEFSRAKSYASEYQGITPKAHFFNTRIQRVSELLGDFTTGKVLDVGCGPGIVGNSFCGRPVEYYGVDVSEEMIKVCIDTYGNVRQFRFFRGRIEELPFSECCFDVVLCLGAFEYVMDGPLAMCEIVRVLKPNGTVIITMLNEMSPYRLWQRLVYWKLVNGIDHIARLASGTRNVRAGAISEVTLYREKAFRQLLVSAGLRIEDVLYYDFNLFFSPLDSLFPEASVFSSNKMECLCRGKLKFLGTGYMLKCRKND